MTETEEKKEFTREEITGHFDQNDKVKVVFEKADGSMRTLIGTRKTEVIPEEHRPQDNPDKPKRPTPDHLFSVFDLENNGFRSFTIAKVHSIEPV